MLAKRSSFGLGVVDSIPLPLEVDIGPLDPSGLADPAGGGVHGERQRNVQRPGMGAERIHPFQIDRRLDLLGEVEPPDADRRA